MGHTTGIEKGAWRKLEVLITVVAIMMAAYQMVSAILLFENELEFMNNHLGFALLLTFLYSMKAKKKRWRIYLAGAVLSLLVAGYIKVFFEQIQWRFGFPTPVDIVVDILLIALCMVAAREQFGLIIPVLGLVFMSYTFLAAYLPPPLYHPAGGPVRVLAMFTTSFSGSGIYGVALMVSASYIFLYLLFGGLIQVAGGTDSFLEIAKLVGRKLRGGPAQVSVISSALTATVTGAAMANVMITGVFTIPAMKKVGFEPAKAGAVEAVASAGSIVTPPVMGAVAFLMSALTGIPYVQIMAAAALPAVFYYWSCFTNIELYARSIDLPPTPVTRMDWGVMLRKGPLFVVPLGTIIVLLLQGRSPMHAAFYAIVGVMALFLAINVLTREHSWRKCLSLLLDGTVRGAKTGAGIAVTCAVLGLLMGMTTMTGVGLLLSHLVAAWSNNILLLAALIAMVVCLLLGTVVVGVVAYALTAILAAPVLMQWDLTLMQVHMFILYYGALSAITPPVAVAALAASSISGASYIRTAFASFSMAAGIFAFPFIFLWNPTLLGDFSDPLSAVLTLLSLIVGIPALNMAVTGFSLVRIHARERALFLLCFVGFLGYALTFNYALLMSGAVLFTVLILRGRARARQLRFSAATAGTP